MLCSVAQLCPTLCDPTYHVTPSHLILSPCHISSPCHILSPCRISCHPVVSCHLVTSCHLKSLSHLILIHHHISLCHPATSHVRSHPVTPHVSRHISSCHPVTSALFAGHCQGTLRPLQVRPLPAGPLLPPWSEDPGSVGWGGARWSPYTASHQHSYSNVCHSPRHTCPSGPLCTIIHHIHVHALMQAKASRARV